MIRVAREKLLRELESVQPGLAPRGLIQQSSCFVFCEGRVVTFNDEVHCSHQCCLKVTGAVEALPLLGILRQLKEEQVKLWTTKAHLRLKGKGGKRIALNMEANVLLPFGIVESPSKWKKLPQGFLEAMAMVQQCAAKDSGPDMKDCVHIAKDWLEASDNYQMARFDIDTKIKTPTLVQRNSVKDLANLGVSHFSETEHWLHFKNSTGLVLSMRRYNDAYPVDIGKWIKTKGQKTMLPKGLGLAAQNAGVFSAENSDDDLITLSLNRNRIVVTGQGDHGEYIHPLKSKYEGDPMSFMIPPELLIDLTKTHNSCQLTDKLLKVSTKGFRYVTRLTKAKETK